MRRCRARRCTLITSLIAIGTPPSGSETSAVLAALRAVRDRGRDSRESWDRLSDPALRALRALPAARLRLSAAFAADPQTERAVSSMLYSMTFGTMKSRFAWRGALESASSGVNQLARLVLAEDVEHGIGVRGGLHAGDIHLFQLLHVGEHLRKLALKLGDFFFAEMQAGELRGVADIEFGTHWGGKLKGSEREHSTPKAREQGAAFKKPPEVPRPAQSRTRAACSSKPSSDGNVQGHRCAAAA